MQDRQGSQARVSVGSIASASYVAWKWCTQTSDACRLAHNSQLTD